MAEYRWNLDAFAVSYDAAAEHIHPHYVELQERILDLVELPRDTPALLVDAGGGSGRLMEKALQRWPAARGVVVDQSPAFLALAERRLAPFGSRAICLLARLQDDWVGQLPAAPNAVLSMSAIHHFTPQEKHDLHRRIAAALVPGGLFLNGDEVRPEGDEEYLKRLQRWAAQMQSGLAEGRISPEFQPALDKWTERNIARFGEPKTTGDDCHQTIDELLADFRAVGFAQADCPWQHAMWAILRGSQA